jgi:hypothetical protein
MDYLNMKANYHNRGESFGDVSMNNLTALSLSIGILSGVATFLCVGPTAGLFLIWAATIAWAAYFALGATDAALKSVIVCGAFGVLMASITAILIASVAGSAAFSILASLAVAISVIVLCLAAHFPELAAIPASVLGYSATFAYLLEGGKLNHDVLLGISWGNPLLIVTASIAIGAYFGKGSVLFSNKILESFNKK